MSLSEPSPATPHRHHRRRLLLYLTVFLLFPATVTAVDLVPFRVANRNPLIQIYGLPAAGEATLLETGRAAAVLSLDVASSHTENADADEAVLLDGESYYLNLDLRLGLVHRLELTLDLPWVSHRHGVFDGFINDWHDAFNLPGGGRDEAPEDRLLYRYSRNGEERLRLDRGTEGPGDLRLGAGWQLLGGAGQPSCLALRGNLKLPTGDDERLLGSGGTDLALWLTGRREVRLHSGRLACFGAAGLLYAGTGDVLPGLQRHWIAFGSFGTGYALREWIAFKLQFDGHTPFYRSSDLEELSDASVQLTLGGTLAFSDRWALDIGVSEDIVVNTSPDVVLHLALRHLF